MWVSPLQNKASRDPSSYVKLSVGKKTFTSKVRQLLWRSEIGNGGPTPLKERQNKGSFLMLQAYKALGIPSLCGRWLHQEQASGIRAYLGAWSEATPFCYTDCPQVPQSAGGHTGQSVSTWPSGDLSLFCSQTCPHSKDPVWSQVFSFFVHSVAAEQLCLKVCLE